TQITGGNFFQNNSYLAVATGITRTSGVGGDSRFDPWFADEGIDVNRDALPEAVDPADALLEHRGVPGQLDVDAGARGALQVEADAAGIAREENAAVWVVVEVHDILRATLLALLPGEERRPDARARQLGARRPVREPEHPPPLAEHHDFASLGQNELTDQLAQLQELRARQAPKRGVGGLLDPRQVGPDLLEAQLGKAVADDALRGEQGHQAQKLRLRERTPLRAAQDLRDRRDERVVLVHLLGGHLDRNPRV